MSGTTYLTRNYLIVLGILFVLLVITAVFVQVSLADQVDDAVLINLSGRQRSLSQQMARDALLLVYQPDEWVEQDRIAEIADKLALFQRVHVGLQQGDAALGLLGFSTVHIEQMYTGIQPDYAALVEGTACLLAFHTPDRTDHCAESEQSYLRMVLDSSETFFNSMDQIVAAYQTESVRSRQRIAWVQGWFALLNLGALIGLGIFIIRPTIERVEAAQRELITSERIARETSARLAALIENMNSGILVENENRKIVVVNQAFCDMFGAPVPPAALIGEDCPTALDTTAPLFAEPTAFRQRIDHLLRERQPVYDEEWRLADGRIFQRDYVPIFLGKDYRGHLWQYLDISARKQAERSMQTQNEALVNANQELARARKQAETANQHKTKFLATISHELRTPLNAIIGYAELQLAGIAGELTPEQRRYQSRIASSAENVLELINDLLDHARLEAGFIDLTRAPFDIRACLNQTIDESRVLAENKGLHLELSIDDQLPGTITTDERRIKQIVTNLTANAIKFTDRGQVTVEAHLNGTDTWYIRVHDTGIGIPEERLETIFEEFRQAEGGRERGGSGLGLAIVRKLVDMMGGQIQVGSKVGAGSTFTVTLPLESKTTQPQKQGADRSEAQSGA